MDHFLLIQGSNRTRNHSELQAAYLQQLLLCTAVVWKTTCTIYSIKLFLTDLFNETTRVCLVAYKLKHFCITDQKAVQRLFTVVLNLTSCDYGNHGCQKITWDWNLTDYNFNPNQFYDNNIHNQSTVSSFLEKYASRIFVISEILLVLIQKRGAVISIKAKGITACDYTGTGSVTFK